MIRLAEEKDIQTILEITKYCAKSMISNGVFQWNDEYPNLSAFQLG